MKLLDNVAVVTGAASPIGMGRAFALAFAREGADVVVCDIKEEGLKEREEEIKKLGRKALAVKTDVSKAAEDNSYAAIENADVIEVGQKLVIPTAQEASAIMGSEQRHYTSNGDT